METTEKLVLDADSFDSILAMLQSNDKENEEVAFSVINNCDKEKSLVYLLYLHRLSNEKAIEWEKRAPLAFEYLKTTGYTPDRETSYKDILDIIKASDIDEKSSEFSYSYFGKYLLDTIQKLGYDFVENIEVKIKVKNESTTNK